MSNQKNNTSMITCEFCRRTLIYNAFKTSSKTKNGRTPWCKKCENKFRARTWKFPHHVADRLYHDIMLQVEFQTVGKTEVYFNKTLLTQWIMMNPFFLEHYDHYNSDESMKWTFVITLDPEKSVELHNLKLEYILLPKAVKIPLIWEK